MKKSDPRRSIAWTNMPARMPIWPTIAVWLLLDRLKAPGWVWGIVGTFFAFMWFAWAYDVATSVRVDIFEGVGRNRVVSPSEYEKE